MSLVKHAEEEFKNLGWPGDCEMQAEICKNIIELLAVFSNQGHSGSTAPYALNLFDKLARFKTISPLTGDDDEWVLVGESHYQNKRDGEVFKNEEGESYWSSGKVFIDPDGCAYTSAESRVSITFPWTRPDKPEYIHVTDDD